MIDRLRAVSGAIVREDLDAANVLRLNPVGGHAASVGDHDHVLNPTVLGQLDAALYVDGGARLHRRVGQEPLLPTVDVDAVTSKIEDELIDPGAVDELFDCVVDLVRMHFLAAGVGDELGMAPFGHPLRERPLVHAPGSCRGIVELLKVSGLIDPDKHARSDH